MCQCLAAGMLDGQLGLQPITQEMHGRAENLQGSQVLAGIYPPISALSEFCSPGTGCLRDAQ